MDDHPWIPSIVNGYTMDNYQWMSDVHGSSMDIHGSSADIEDKPQIHRLSVDLQVMDDYPWSIDWISIDFVFFWGGSGRSVMSGLPAKVPAPNPPPHLKHGMPMNN